MEFVWTEGVKREKLFGALAYAVYVQGSVHKKERKKSLEKGQISNFLLVEKGKERN